MGFFDIFNAPRPIGGEIAYHKLVEWWRDSLSETDRKRILEIFHPLGSAKDALTEGKIVSSSESTLAFLSSLAGWFKKDGDRAIGYKILQQAERYVQVTRSVLDIHFFYQECIEMHYRDNLVEEHLIEAERACRNQISMAKRSARAFKRDGLKQLPEHLGYRQLSIILEARMAYKEALEIARQAKSEGWSGDWETKIERYSKH